MPGTLFVVATPIGNLEDISARALSVLGRVAVIAAEDTRHTARLLARYAIKTSTTSVHEHNERKQTGRLITRLLAGDDIALVSDAGTPAVSDPGALLIRTAIDAGIRVEPIPGPSAPLAALVASGLPTDTFTFLGFPPAKGKARSAWFEQLRTAGRTVVFFEAPHRIVATLQQLRDVIGDRNIAIARELTKKHEELVRGPIKQVLERIGVPRGEYTVIADVGYTTNLMPQTSESAAKDEALLDEIGRITDTNYPTRRRTIGLIAKRYGLTVNQVYSALERAKLSVKRQNDS
jgi:16S rRNA (cytidine1402-2'-O)-methyltransferase